MRNTNESQTFEEYASQYPAEYLTDDDNYYKVVREFYIKEITGENRKVIPPSIIKGKKDSVLVRHYTFEQYKQMANEALNQPLANKQGVINTLLDNYINKPFTKTKSDASQIYDNLRNGANNTITGIKFLYFSNLIAIEELIKFEMYLRNGCKENKKRAGRKAVKQLSAEQYLLVSDDHKQVFLDALKNKFKDSNKKTFCYFLVALHQLKYLNMENQQNVFNSFSKYFGKDYGSYSNFNIHWKNHNDKELLKTTKESIIAIKINNVIM